MQETNKYPLLLTCYSRNTEDSRKKVYLLLSSTKGMFLPFKSEHLGQCNTKS